MPVEPCPACQTPIETPGEEPGAFSCPFCAATVRTDGSSVTVVGRSSGSAEFSRSALVLTPEFVAAYRLGRLLGVGAMGAVYQALHLPTGRDVAVKFMLGEPDPEMVARFVREGRALARISHPNVIRVLDAGAIRTCRYLVADLLRGGSLKTALDRERTMAVPRAASIIAECLDGLGACHEKGVIHRDFKPANVLFDEHGSALVADFGLAWMATDVAALTRAGELLGTPKYVAPEQIGSGTLTPAADLYAVGVVLFEMISGRLPFTAKSLPELLRKHLKEPPPRLWEIVPTCPRDLGQLVDRALSKDPAARPGSAAGFAAYLRAIVGGAGPSRRSGARQPRKIPGEPAARSAFQWAVPVLILVALAVLVAQIAAPPPGGAVASPSPTVSFSVTARLTSSPPPDLPDRWRGRLALIYQSVGEFAQKNLTEATPQLWFERATMVADPERARLRLESILADLLRAVTWAQEAGLSGESWLEVEPLGERILVCAGHVKPPAGSTSVRLLGKLEIALSGTISDAHERCVARSLLPWILEFTRGRSNFQGERARGRSEAAAILETEWRAGRRPPTSLELCLCVNLRWSAASDWRRIETLIITGDRKPRGLYLRELDEIERTLAGSFDALRSFGAADPHLLSTLSIALSCLQARLQAPEVALESRRASFSLLRRLCPLVSRSHSGNGLPKTVRAFWREACGGDDEGALRRLGLSPR